MRTKKDRRWYMSRPERDPVTVSACGIATSQRVALLLAMTFPPHVIARSEATWRSPQAHRGTDRCAEIVPPNLVQRGSIAVGSFARVFFTVPLREKTSFSPLVLAGTLQHGPRP